MRPRPSNRVPFISSLWIDESYVNSWDEFPYTIPAVRAIKSVELHPAVTFFIGENGSGKSTLMEAIAARLSFEDIGGDAEVGTHNRFDHRALDGGLQDSLRICEHLTRKPGDRFFMRAETVYDLASTLVANLGKDRGSLDRYGSTSLHTKSHGEAFLEIVQSRLRQESLILMDEPEAALSPQRQLTLLGEIDWLVRAGCQFLIATHSPILMAYPDARMYRLDTEGIHETEWKQTEHYELTKSFLNNPDAYLRHLVE